MSILFDYQGYLTESELPTSFDDLYNKAKEISNSDFLLIFNGKQISNSEDFEKANIQPDALIVIVGRTGICSLCYDKGILALSSNGLDPYCKDCADGYPRLLRIRDDYYKFDCGLWRPVKIFTFVEQLTGLWIDNAQKIYDILHEDQYKDKYMVLQNYDFFKNPPGINHLSDGTIFNVRTKVLKDSYPWDGNRSPFPVHFVENPTIDPVKYFSTFTDEPEKMVYLFQRILLGEKYEVVIIGPRSIIDNLLRRCFGYHHSIGYSEITGSSKPRGIVTIHYRLSILPSYDCIHTKSNASVPMDMDTISELYSAIALSC